MIDYLFKIKENWFHFVLSVAGTIGLILSGAAAYMVIANALVGYGTATTSINWGSIIINSTIYVGWMAGFSCLVDYATTKMRNAKRMRLSGWILITYSAIACAVMITGLIMINPTPEGIYLYMTILFMIAIGLIPLTYGLRERKIMNEEVSSIALTALAVAGVVVGIIFLVNMPEFIAPATSKYLGVINAAWILVTIAAILGFLTLTYNIVRFRELGEKVNKIAKYAVLGVGGLAFIIAVIAAFLALPYYTNTFEFYEALSNRFPENLNYIRWINNLILSAVRFYMMVALFGIVPLIYGLRQFFPKNEPKETAPAIENTFTENPSL
ncbi:MAG: hypothetical protein FWE79_01560 [Firmicutes bacterium]|nr:hypothetical protein [Bacillota bacterium]